MADEHFELDDGTTQIEIARPVFGYRSVIGLPFTIQKLDNKHYDIYDEGVNFDYRTCDCELQLDVTDYESLLTILNDTGRTEAITMTLPVDSGFYPFCPDKADNGAYTVTIQLINAEGIGENPYKYFKIKVRIVNEGSFPAYSYPTEQDDGTWTFGTITGIRFPPNWFKPKTNLGIYSSMAFDGSIDYVDRGTNADVYNTKIGMNCNNSKASRILNYIVGTSRGEAFQITTVSDNYAFDFPSGSDETYNVKLIQKEISVIHTMFNQFKFDINLNLISVA